MLGEFNVSARANDDHPADLRLDLIYSCPGSPNYDVAVGLEPTPSSITATSASWAANFDSSLACPNGTLRPVLTDFWNRVTAPELFNRQMVEHAAAARCSHLRARGRRHDAAVECAGSPWVGQRRGQRRAAGLVAALVHQRNRDRQLRRLVWRYAQPLRHPATGWLVAAAVGTRHRPVDRAAGRDRLGWRHPFGRSDDPDPARRR